MRVLQINATYGYGSTGRNVMEMDGYLNSLCQESYVAYGIITEKKDKNIFRVGDIIDHKCHALLMRITKKQGSYSRLATRKLCRAISKLKPDIVHLHNLHSNFICLNDLLEFLVERKIRTVLTLHDCWFFTGRCYHYYGYTCDQWKTGCEHCLLARGLTVSRQEPLLWKKKKELFQQFDKLAVVGVSNWITEEAKKSILKDVFCVRKIYNWVDHSIFHPVDATEIREKSGFKNRKIILGISQGWSYNKGLQEMLAIAQQLREHVVVLIGEMERITLPDNVISVGYIKDVQQLVKYYSAAHVFVNPSKMETFGKVTAEALACGTPVVVYDNTGLREIVGDGCGLIAKNNDIEDLVCCVKRIIGKEKNIFSNRCIEYSKKEFDIQKQLNKYYELYKELMIEE